MWCLWALLFDLVLPVDFLRRSRAHSVSPDEMDFAWKYEAPELWPVTCLNGPQSPKAFLAFNESNVSEDKLLFQFRPIVSNLDVVHNGRSISITLPKAHGGFGIHNETFADLTPEHEVYSFWQLALHHPSEHLFNGKELPVELQLFHTRAGSISCRQAVVSIGFDSEQPTSPIVGLTSAFLDKLADKIPQRAGTRPTDGTVFDVTELFQEPVGDGTFQDATFARYNGSITVPPCQNADVFVRTVPIQASFKAVEKIKDALAPNARKREGDPIEVQLYRSVDCSGMPPPGASTMAVVDPLQKGAVANITCADASDILSQYPVLRKGALSMANPNLMVKYCDKVIRAITGEEDAKGAYEEAVSAKKAACNEAQEKNAAVKESLGPNDQLRQGLANSSSFSCTETEMVLRAQKMVYESAKKTRRAVVSRAKEQIQKAKDIASLGHEPEFPMVKQKQFQCNAVWPFGSAADTVASKTADSMIPKTIGNPTLALA